MEETIHQEATGTDMCPVKSLARVIHTILQDCVTIDTLICASTRKDIWGHV